MRGHVDLVSLNRIEGWAQNIDHPEAPVCLDIYAGRKADWANMVSHRCTG